MSGSNVRSRAAPALALVLFAALALPFVEYRTDDTFIFLRFASNLAGGQGFAFNPGEPVYGFTSVLWVLLLAVAAGAGLPALAAAKGIAFLLGGAAVAGFAVLARRRLAPGVAAAATVAFAANAWLVRWSAAAMETALSTALVAWALARLAAEAEDEALPPLAAALLALAVLARPEAAILLALGLAADLLGGRRARRRGLAGAAIAALLLAPWFVYAWRTFGAVVPLTAAAKGSFDLRALDLDPLADVAKVVVTTSALEALLIAAGAAALAAAARRGARLSRLDLRRHGPALGWLAGLPLLYLVTGFDVLSRYAVPLLPVVVLYGFAALARLAGARAPRLAARLAAALAALVLVQNGIVLGRVVYPHTHSFSRGVAGCLGELGRWCAAHTPAGSTVAIADIGAFGYYSGRRVLDLAGLISPELVPIVNEHPIDEIAGRLLFADLARPDYLVDRHPEAERLAGALGGTFEPLRSCRIEGLGVRAPAPVAYTLYRLHWDRYDAWRRP